MPLSACDFHFPWMTINYITWLCTFLVKSNNWYVNLILLRQILIAIAGSRSALFAATDPQVPEYTEMLKADEWPVCAFISQDCRPTNPSEEAHSVETSYKVWEKTLELIGLPSDAVEKLIEGEEVKCKYGASQ